jgi:D-glycero-D-manno-heptose 1,7-bisphosphate phosphatase
MSEDELSRIHSLMAHEINAGGGSVERVYACTHAPEAGCACRKPGTELFTRAQNELDIALDGSFMVGDSESDVLAARAVGARPILLGNGLSGNGHGEVALAQDLPDAVRVIATLRAGQRVRHCS